MNGVLDIVALRSLTSIVDSGGFRRAAETLHLSQSAVSQHVRRLEQACGCALVERTGRHTRLTAAGDMLVVDARQILAIHDDALDRLGSNAVDIENLTVGATEHAADVLLPAITAALRTAFPQQGVHYRIDRGARLTERLAEGVLDAAVLIGAATGENTCPAGSLPLGWYAAPDWERPPSTRPIPLVVIDGQCTIRRRAVHALDAENVDAVVVCEAGHLAGVFNATRAGIGVALLAVVDEPDGLREVSGLPRVAPEPLHVKTRGAAPAHLGAILADAVTGVLRETAPSS